MEFVRGSIWYVESGYSTGSEQRPGRPAIIVSNDVNNKHSSTVEMAYLTTAPKHDLPTHVTIRSTSRVSTAICEQITTVATERIGNYCGAVTDAEMRNIETAMLISLGLAPAAGVDPQPNAQNEETPPIPDLDTRLAEAEARCKILQELYDSLLTRLLKVS